MTAFRKRLSPRLGLVVLSHPLEVGWQQAASVLSSVSLQVSAPDLSLLRAPCVISDPATAQQVAQAFRDQDLHALLVIPATWSADDPLLDLLEDLPLPVVVWGLPGVETGSLCGSHQINSVLKQLGRHCHLVYGALDAPSAHAEVAAFARAAALVRQLRQAKIALVGHRTPGMTEVAFDEFALKTVLGPRVIHLSLEAFSQLMDRSDPQAAQAQWDALASQVAVVEVEPQERTRQLQALVAMQALMQEHDLAGIAFECYPNWMGRVCIPFSILSAQGLAAGCEADVNGTVALVMLQSLAAAPGFNTDLLAVSGEDNSILLSHCGNSALSLAAQPSGARVAPVRLADKGACLLFPARPGRVTLANLLGASGSYRLTTIAAEAVPTGMDFPGNPLRVRLPIPVGDFLNLVGQEGIGHHWMAVYGHFAPELRHFSRLIGLRHLPIP